VRVVRWNLAPMTEKDAEAAEKLWMELAKERAQLDAECTEDEVVQEDARAKAELEKSIRQSKRNMWGDYLQNLRGAEVGRAARHANPRAGMTVEALTDRDGKRANTSLEKEEMLRHESIPPNDGDQYYELSPAGSTHTRVTEQAVEQAL